ncbi:nuclear receptor 2C2-associated protein isoform X2 [Larus michahellis]
MPVEPLICADTATRVSSVLNRDVKQFGKKHMFDASEETCWNSDQGTCQWVTLDFPRTVKVSQLHIQFQGGFSSRLCMLEGCRAGEELVKISDLYPEDTHAMQISFAALRAGSKGSVGAFSEPPAAAEGHGGRWQSYHLNDGPAGALGTLLPLKQLGRTGANPDTTSRDSRWRRRCWIS